MKQIYMKHTTCVFIAPDACMHRVQAFSYTCILFISIQPADKRVKYLINSFKPKTVEYLINLYELLLLRMHAHTHTTRTHRGVGGGGGGLQV